MICIQIFPLFFKKPVKKVEAGYWVSRMVLMAKLFDVKNQIQNFLHGDKDDSNQLGFKESTSQYCK